MLDNLRNERFAPAPPKRRRSGVLWWLIRWSASLVAVCHSFGILCRWSGIANPQRRGEEGHRAQTRLSGFFAVFDLTL